MSCISLYPIFAQLLKLLGFWISAKKHPQLGSAPTKKKTNPGLAGGEIHQGHECLYRDRSDLIVCISLAGGPCSPRSSGGEAIQPMVQPAWWSIMTGDSENLWQLASFRAWFNKDVSLFMTWIIHPPNKAESADYPVYCLRVQGGALVINWFINPMN